MKSDMVKVHIRKLLKEQGLSMYKVAKDTGLAYTTLWKLENGYSQGVSFDVLEKLCNRLDCSPADLFSVEIQKRKRAA